MEVENSKISNIKIIQRKSSDKVSSYDGSSIDEKIQNYKLPNSTFNIPEWNVHIIKNSSEEEDSEEETKDVARLSSVSIFLPRPPLHPLI